MALQVAEQFEKEYGKKLNDSAATGYIYAEILVEGLKNAGRNLTLETFVKGLESIKNYKSPFLGPDRSYSPENHAGHKKAWLVKVHNKRWVPQNGKTPVYLTY